MAAQDLKHRTRVRTENVETTVPCLAPDLRQRYPVTETTLNESQEQRKTTRPKTGFLSVLARLAGEIEERTTA